MRCSSQRATKRGHKRAAVRAAAVTGRRQRQRPLQQAGGGRYINRAAHAHGEAAVTGSGRQLRRPLHKEGGDEEAAVTGSGRRPLHKEGGDERGGRYRTWVVA
jgi:hypothetical protein